MRSNLGENVYAEGRQAEDAGRNLQGMNTQRRQTFQNNAAQGEYPYAQQGSAKAASTGASQRGALQQQVERRMGAEQPAPTFRELEQQGRARPSPAGVAQYNAPQYIDGAPDGPDGPGPYPHKRPMVDDPMGRVVDPDPGPTIGPSNPEAPSPRAPTVHNADGTSQVADVRTGQARNYTTDDVNSGRVQTGYLDDGTQVYVPSEEMGDSYTINDFLDTAKAFDGKTEFGDSWRNLMLANNPKLYQQLLDQGGYDAVNAFRSGKFDDVTAALTPEAKLARDQATDARMTGAGYVKNSDGSWSQPAAPIDVAQPGADENEERKRAAGLPYTDATGRTRYPWDEDQQTVDTLGMTQWNARPKYAQLDPTLFNRRFGG